MTMQAQKLLDFSRLLVYRVGEYIPLPSMDPTVKRAKNEVHGIAEA
jgi:hypothetical protein